MNRDLENMRSQYLKHTLNRTDLLDEGMDQFKTWWQDALKANVNEANTFILSTVRDNRPSSRVVLIKGVTENGIQFYTNYESRKGQDMETNPNVSACFLWIEQERQVRIEGTVSKISREESERYFQSRPRESQISAWTSPQSKVVGNRDVLQEWRDRIEMKFQHVDPLPVPEFWGGYELHIQQIEFWQGRADRLHDRFQYVREINGWNIERLAP